MIPRCLRMQGPCTSPAAVRTHLRHIYRKLGVNNRSSLCRRLTRPDTAVQNSFDGGSDRQESAVTAGRTIELDAQR